MSFQGILFYEIDLLVEVGLRRFELCLYLGNLMGLFRINNGQEKFGENTFIINL